MTNKLKVAVLYGGTSSEREVSLNSGKAVHKALINKNYDSKLIDMTYENILELIEYQPDVAFISMHGELGEDGTVQGLLEFLKIPYTHSRTKASAVCMDKILTKKVLSFNGISTPAFEIISSSDLNRIEDKINQLEIKIGFPMVIKASSQGSSIGTEIVYERRNMQTILEKIARYGSNILVEKFIDGKELTVPVLGNSNIKVLPIIEIDSKNEFYDYEAKYSSGMSDHIIPPRINENILKEINFISKEVYKQLECRGIARVDFMMDKDNIPYVIEVNTIPGMTETSLVPESAATSGVYFDELVEKILNLALED